MIMSSLLRLFGALIWEERVGLNSHIGIVRADETPLDFYRQSPPTRCHLAPFTWGLQLLSSGA